MRTWGSVLVVAVLLGSTACTHAVRGRAVAGDMPPRTESSAPTAERVAECTGCDADAVDAATENPVVRQGKRVESPPACEEILPMATIGQTLGVHTHPGSPFPDQCHVVWENDDLSVIGQLFVMFSGPSRRAPANISEFEGNTLIETVLSANTCQDDLAISDTLDRWKHGSWLILRVNTENATPPPCELARQFLEFAFARLSDT